MYEMADQRLWQNYEWDFIESSALVSATASRVAEQQSWLPDLVSHTAELTSRCLWAAGSHATGGSWSQVTNECRFSPTSRTRILTQWQCRHVLPADPTDFPHSFRPQASLSSALPLRLSDPLSRVFPVALPAALSLVLSQGLPQGLPQGPPGGPR